MADDQEPENVNIGQLRISGYKTLLNILRGRLTNLKIEENLELTAHSFDIADIRFPELLKQVEALQAFVGHLVNIKKAIATLKTNQMFPTFEEASSENEEVEEAIVEIDELCRAVVPYHNANSVNDNNFYKLRLKYSKTLARYAEILGRKRETGTGTENNALQKKMENAERTLKKLNVTRTITMMLIAAFMSDHEAYPEINGFRNSIRRDLVLEDFKETWDVGLKEED